MNIHKARMVGASYLMKAKFFVVLTDKQASLALDGVDPYSFTDVLALNAQAAELELFRDKLTELIKEHKKARKQLGGIADAVTSDKAPTGATAKAKAGEGRTKVRADAKKTAQNKKGN
jgi:hypothetical protein